MTKNKMRGQERTKVEYELGSTIKGLLTEVLRRYRCSQEMWGLTKVVFSVQPWPLSPQEPIDWRWMEIPSTRFQVIGSYRYYQARARGHPQYSYNGAIKGNRRRHNHHRSKGVIVLTHEGKLHDGDESI